MNGIVSFAHGKESGPWGIKIRHLAKIATAQGFAVESPDYSDTMNPTERVQRLSTRHFDHPNLILAGSSMGGYVAAFSSDKLQPKGVFLMAPALYMPGWDNEPPATSATTTVVHGWNDDIIPVENAIRYAQTQRASLHVLNSGHTLNDSLPALGEIFSHFLQRSLESSTS